MATHEVVYVGGPRHGEREVREGDPFTAPRRIGFPTYPSGTTVYRLEEMADTPGALAYVFEEVKDEPA